MLIRGGFWLALFSGLDGEAEASMSSNVIPGGRGSLVICIGRTCLLGAASGTSRLFSDEDGSAGGGNTPANCEISLTAGDIDLEEEPLETVGTGTSSTPVISIEIFFTLCTLLLGVVSTESTIVITPVSLELFLLELLISVPFNCLQSIVFSSFLVITSCNFLEFFLDFNNSAKKLVQDMLFSLAILLISLLPRDLFLCSAEFSDDDEEDDW